ncbi:bifunctional riboflavin kinase/FAD synthetase [Bacteriovorax stolpii]|uniref:Riboflavin biosynthesis protein n=1 Tax=Bacteriovorax stolpii TaxID=960 RepID=A0A2K9NPD8_BACTC|nr:bifunctional riboflavin kinase/FAD synthetase [Bacteriovorax stolpii]AUN96634.1 riboflavin biosynthesis protein RibF [Bacteriovorax stolpii]QDK43434.1 bifunctional riboflavin kinase/FAD synthetase [Bacteriovorax stolpii]TDP53845.1 FMN adenylyltransferase /riboflavin kinase [Bacteriovorax stolpii]
MIVVKDLKELKNVYNENKINVTIGNFDGVHLGHREFLAHIKKDSVQDHAKFVVVTFVPHPLQILKSHTGFLINTYAERRELLAECGVDYLLEIDFTRDFSTLSPEAFLEKFIFSFDGIAKIYLGHDFAFGANKSGDFHVAKTFCDTRKTSLILQQEFKVKSSPVSSTEVRTAIQSGSIEKVSELLGRNYFLSGRVIKGEGRGKKIGFPTANLGYDKELIIPAKGVYITQVKIKDMVYNSVTNIGVNPTFNTGYDIHVESHLLDFTHDIYGEEIRVSFIKKLRDEKKFPSVNDLVAQIKADADLARDYFKHE